MFCPSPSARNATDSDARAAAVVEVHAYVISQYAIGKDAAAMKAVVGEEALSTEEKVRFCPSCRLHPEGKGSKTHARPPLYSSHSSSSAGSRTSLSSRGSTRTGPSLNRSTSHGVCSGSSRAR